jgi:hypothetical protein
MEGLKIEQPKAIHEGKRGNRQGLYIFSNGGAV